MLNEGAPMTRLYVFCGVCFGMALVYGILQATPNPRMDILLSGGPPVAVVMWLVRDSKQQRVAVVQDAGFLFYITWPLLIPWYTLKTRGRAGWALALRLYALALAGFAGVVCGGLIGLIWHP
jgi:hypothetical protein